MSTKDEGLTSSPNNTKPCVVCSCLLNRDIESCNKMLADLLGAKQGDAWQVYNGLRDYYDAKYLNFHTDYNSLMKVVEKIELYGCIVEIWLSVGKGCKIIMPNNNPVVIANYENNNLIEAIWMACIDAAEYIFENKKTDND